MSWSGGPNADITRGRHPSFLSQRAAGGGTYLEIAHFRNCRCVREYALYSRVINARPVAVIESELQFDAPANGASIAIDPCRLAIRSQYLQFFSRSRRTDADIAAVGVVDILVRIRCGPLGAGLGKATKHNYQCDGHYCAEWCNCRVDGLLINAHFLLLLSKGVRVRTP